MISSIEEVIFKMLWIRLMPLKEIREGFLEAETTQAGNVIVQRLRGIGPVLCPLWLEYRV